MTGDTPLWSILICALASRREKLVRLLAHLLPQCETHGAVEVIAAHDNGQVPVAVKRQALLSAARGKYVSFVDDDDTVDPRFVELCTAAMAGDPDYVAFPNAYYVAGVRQPVEIRVGLQYDTLPDTPGVLYRPVTHVNPVRAALARQADFTSVPGRLVTGEDWIYATTVRELARTQAVASDKPLYHYFHDPADSVQHGTMRLEDLPRPDVDSPCFRWLEEPV